MMSNQIFFPPSVFFQNHISSQTLKQHYILSSNRCVIHCSTPSILENHKANLQVTWILTCIFEWSICNFNCKSQNLNKLSTNWTPLSLFHRFLSSISILWMKLKRRWPAWTEDFRLKFGLTYIEFKIPNNIQSDNFWNMHLQQLVHKKNRLGCFFSKLARPY